MRYAVNLLSEKKKSLLDGVLYFVLFYLRYILVITQIVVIFVFFYRFKIDQEIVDLKDQLMQKEEIVEISKPLLSEAERVDVRTREIKAVLTDQIVFEQSLEYFFNTFPKRLAIEQLDISNDGYRFEVVTHDPESVRAYYERIKKDKRFKRIELGSIRKSGIAFFVPIQLGDFQLKEQPNAK